MTERFLPVAMTFNQGDIALVKSLLDGAGLIYYVENDNFNVVRPWAMAARFMVPEDRAGFARELLAGLDLSYVAAPLRQRSAAKCEEPEEVRTSKGEREMPLVSVSIRKGRDLSVKQAILDAIRDALVATFRISDADCNQRLTEFERDSFELPADRSDDYVLVEITMFEGRSVNTKRALYYAIVRNLSARAGVMGDDVTIVLHEPPLENWAIRGGVSAADAEPDFEPDGSFEDGPGYPGEEDSPRLRQPAACADAVARWSRSRVGEYLIVMLAGEPYGGRFGDQAFQIEDVTTGGESVAIRLGGVAALRVDGPRDVSIGPDGTLRVGRAREVVLEWQARGTPAAEAGCSVTCALTGSGFVQTSSGPTRRGANGVISLELEEDESLLQVIPD